MKRIVSHPTFGTIIYEENFFNGNKSLTVNGKILHQRSETIFVEVDEEKEIEYLVNGNFAAGVVVEIKGVSIQVVPKTQGFEYILYFLPLIFILIWSNVPKLVEILPIVGGLIGGLIGGVASMLSFIYGKFSKNIVFKIFLALMNFVISVGICLMMGLALLK